MTRVPLFVFVSTNWWQVSTVRMIPEKGWKKFFASISHSTFLFFIFIVSATNYKVSEKLKSLNIYKNVAKDFSTEDYFFKKNSKIRTFWKTGIGSLLPNFFFIFILVFSLSFLFNFLKKVNCVISNNLQRSM